MHATVEWRHRAVEPDCHHHGAQSAEVPENDGEVLGRGSRHCRLPAKPGTHQGHRRYDAGMDTGQMSTTYAHSIVFIGYEPGTKAWTKPHLKKLDDRGTLVVFIGYEPGAKAWRFYDIAMRHTIMSRDTVFDESTS